MGDSIFMKIINGEIPCHKIYENDHVLAFLDIHPIQPGHTLVIPKAAIDHIWDLPDQDLETLMAACKLVANRLREVLRPVRVGVQVMGTDVPHAHVHLIPFNTVDEFRHVPDMHAEPDHAALAALAQKLAISRAASSL